MDNAEGSPRSQRTDFSFKQRSVLVGTLLGDGCLAKHGHFHRLHVKHKLAHRSLLEFKYETFREFISMQPHYFDQELGGRRFPCGQFATRTNPLFTEWYSRFYQDGRKFVPTEIADWLNPLAMAVWFMDDGAADFAGVTIQTHNFELEDVERLAGIMKERFDLAVGPRRNKGRWLLYIRAGSLERFQQLVEAHTLKDLAYKLIPRRSRDPVETARWPLTARGEGDDTVRPHWQQ
jgi:recombination protein RecA